MSAEDLAREIENRALVLERAGGMLSATEAANFLGVEPRSLDEVRRAKRLFGIQQGKDWLYPRAQFRDGKVPPGLDTVLPLMQETGPWVTLAFLVSPDSVLGDLTPLQALWREDLRDEVISLARGFGTGNGFA